MTDKLWFVCSHCRAMFRADNNLCISCGAPSNIWEGEAPVLDRRKQEFYKIPQSEWDQFSASAASSSAIIFSTAVPWGAVVPAFQSYTHREAVMEMDPFDE